VISGAGIAQVAAHNAFSVTLCDSSEKALDTGRTVIQQSLARLAKNTHPEDKAAQNQLVQSVFDNIHTTTDPVEALSDADLVVEAIREDLRLKQDLFKLLDRKAPAECIFATNTNTLSVADIASSTSSTRRSR
jgi:3-hydroxyacyl-CoA dehydrogenase